MKLILGKKALPLELSEEELQSMIEELIKEKNWQKFELKEAKLSYKPYYLFNYDAFLEEKSEEGNEAVSDTDSGVIAIDAQTGELSADLSELVEEFEIGFVKQPEGVSDFGVEKPKYSEQEIKQVIPLKLARELEVPRKNIVVSNLQLFFFPVWSAIVSIPMGEFELSINGVNGEIIDGEIPIRKRGYRELAGETIDDLKQPKAWASYSVDIGKAFVSFFQSPIVKRILHELMYNRKAQTIVLLLILLLLVANSIGIIKLF